MFGVVFWFLVRGLGVWGFGMLDGIRGFEFLHLKGRGIRGFRGFGFRVCGLRVMEWFRGFRVRVAPSLP